MTNANIYVDHQRKVFHLSNNQISYLLQVEEGGVLSHLYFGKKFINIMVAESILGLIEDFHRTYRVNRIKSIVGTRRILYFKSMVVSTQVILDKQQSKLSQ
ncbi:hypothetical protein GCM10025879_02990 [Leuconostoc litchii]|nr:hypothetical protein GCM10025879_02990 [Leuconostoc litchii]